MLAWFPITLYLQYQLENLFSFPTVSLSGLYYPHVIIETIECVFTRPFFFSQILCGVRRLCGTRVSAHFR